MIYPKTFESKIGFDEIRSLLRERCLSPLGKEKVDEMEAGSDAGGGDGRRKEKRPGHIKTGAAARAELPGILGVYQKCCTMTAAPSWYSVIFFGCPAGARKRTEIKV